jgi:hypothetical protein
MDKYKTGDFVKHNKQLCVIEKLEDGIAFLSDGHKVDCIRLEPVRIGSPLDKAITLVNETIRYIPGSIKIDHAYNYYLDCRLLGGKTIRDVLDKNPQIQYLHHLQDWLANNAEGFLLKNYNRSI